MTTPMTILISGAPGTGTSTVLAQAPYGFRAQWGGFAALSLDALYGMFAARWLEHTRSYDAAWTQVIDTSTLTPEETLDRIMYHINRGDGQLTEVLVEAYCAR